MESWGQIASKADIVRLDKPLPINKDIGGKGWEPYYGQYSHMFCDEYMQAVDHPFIQDTWHPMWGDCYVIRTGDEREPSRQFMNLWTLRLQRDSYIMHKENYSYSYCWVPSLGQLMGVLVGKGYNTTVTQDLRRGVWVVVILGKRRDYHAEGFTPEVALAIALKELTSRLRMKL